MPKILVWVEHDNAAIKDATLAAVTAASQIGEIHLIVAGSGCAGSPRCWIRPCDSSCPAYDAKRIPLVKQFLYFSHSVVFSASL